MDEKNIKAHVGFDFGTTNSLVCVRTEDDGKVKFLGIENHRDSFPTVIAYDKEDGTRVIGAQARSYRNSEDEGYDAYDNFKLSLGDGARESGGRDKSPLQVTQDFISEVLQKLEEIRSINAENILLVQTVPDVWKHEIENRSALENLAEVYENLGLDTDGQVCFESEPVSAAAYYLKEVCKGEYAGYVIVVDYGGGTLDLTLCRVNENGEIEVLWSCGDGGRRQSGCAGYAFDRAAVKRLVDRYGLDKSEYAPGKPAFGELEINFENSKISAVQATEKALKVYYESGMIFDGKVFDVKDPATRKIYKVYASDLHRAFEEINREPLCQTLEQMKEYCQSNGIDVKDTEKLRVLLVGGFSNLYCVERTVRDSFESEEGNGDARFDNGISREERSLAIAHGACLIAAGITPVVHINQNEMGFFGRNSWGEVVSVPVIERGRPIREYLEPQFSPHTVVRAFHGLPVNLELYFDDGYGKIKMQMGEEFRSICPNYDREKNTYRIGFSIDRHRIPKLHVRDESGAETVTSLYQIISKLPAVRIQEGADEA